MSVATRLARVAFKTSRLLDFVGRRELAAQIGHGESDWPLVILKECTDNALDGCEEAGVAPVIAVKVTTAPGSISISDNGPGLAPETVAGILDYNVRVSSREAYVSPSRGAQGNALKTILAMPFALDGEFGETIVETRGDRHTISFGVDRIRNEPKIRHLRQTSLVKNGTTLSLAWPNSACSILQAANPRFLQIADDFTWLNPHLSLSVDWNDERLIDIKASLPEWKKWLPSKPTSAYWYDADRLTRYMSAHVAHDEDNGRARLVREFVAEFRDLSGSAKQKRVLDAIGAARTSLADYLGDASDKQRIDALLAAMRTHSKPVKAKDLGVIGKDHFQARFLAAGAHEKTFRYQSQIGDGEDGMPVVLETAFGYCPKDRTSRRIITGVNWSPALGNPFREFGRTGEGLEQVLANQRASASEPIVLVVHLASPRVQYSDRGKSALVLPEARV